MRCSPQLSILAGMTAACALLAGGAAHAADEVNLFISPPGEPFTAPLNEPYPIVLWFNQADANKDGKLDAAEMRADAERFFKTLDRNKDGFIGSAEVTIYERYIVPEILSVGALEQGAIVRVSMQTDSGGGEGGDPPEAPRQRLNTNQGAVQFSLFAEPEPVRAADRNFDFRVSLKEFLDQSDRHFEALDANGDGFLTLDELPRTAAEKAAKARRTAR